MLELLKVDLYKLTKSSLVKIVFFISVLSAAHVPSFPSSGYR